MRKKQNGSIPSDGEYVTVVVCAGSPILSDIVTLSLSWLFGSYRWSVRSFPLRSYPQATTWWLCPRSPALSERIFTSPSGESRPLSMSIRILGHSSLIITQACPCGASPAWLAQVSWSGSAGFISHR